MTREDAGPATHGRNVQVQRRVLLGRHALVGVPHALGQDGAARVGEELLLRRALGEEVTVAEVVDLDVFDKAAGACDAEVGGRDGGAGEWGERGVGKDETTSGRPA